MRIYLCALYTFIAKSQGEAKTFTCARYLAHPFSENDEFFGRMYQVASTGRKGHAPEMLAVLNNVVLGLFARQGETNVAHARREFASHLDKALARLVA